jgi:hypothetical protein
VIGTSGGLLEFQAILILKTFAIHVFPSRAMGIPKTFCDIVGMIPGGTMIGVKLIRSFSTPFSPEQARRFFRREISAMKSCCPPRPCRLEFWIYSKEDRWQFFEISGDDVREVFHAGRP